MQCSWEGVASSSISCACWLQSNQFAASDGHHGATTQCRIAHEDSAIFVLLIEVPHVRQCLGCHAKKAQACVAAVGVFQTGVAKEKRVATERHRKEGPLMLQTSSSFQSE
ncbi:hypothetical protein KP509_16G050400 [Ceratopteris richardii]|uniref:Uncharacterized protein n=1 Tax=Ceratopteris richardii TaxID=49495 RepID=A0A8T2T2D5_CERRI|nr:hypothetical protein KP509_16G050400 [Ceratopteris richardii]